MKGFFETVAKCGHVGRDRYYEGHFFLAAESAREAARVVRYLPRVKSDHPDAILRVERISRDEYERGLRETRDNPYFRCGSRREQNALMDLIADGIRPETERALAYGERHNRLNRVRKTKRDRDGIRNRYKYERYNAIPRDADYERMRSLRGRPADLA